MQKYTVMHEVMSSITCAWSFKRLIKPTNDSYFDFLCPFLLFVFVLCFALSRACVPLTSQLEVKQMNSDQHQLLSDYLRFLFSLQIGQLFCLFFFSQVYVYG